MTSTEKPEEPLPLNVRVAVALNCTPLRAVDRWVCLCKDKAHAEETILKQACHSHSGLGCDFDVLAPYGEDSPEGWSCIGGLISKYHIKLCCGQTMQSAYSGEEPKLPKIWWAETNLDGWEDPFPWGTRWEGKLDAPSAPEAVCNLILALSEAGRLEEKE